VACSPSGFGNGIEKAAPKSAQGPPLQFCNTEDYLDNRINTGFLPLGSFVADAMQQAAVDVAERDRKFVAGLAPERQRLRERQWPGSEGLRSQTMPRWPAT
jgi:hypothetical protein